MKRSGYYRYAKQIIEQTDPTHDDMIDWVKRIAKVAENVYGSHEYRKLLNAHGLIGSMSKKGDCWDNAVVESFFGSLKNKRVHWRNYQTRYEAQQDILNYISMFYNSHRLHSYLGYQSPNQYEQEMVKLKKAA